MRRLCGICQRGNLFDASIRLRVTHDLVKLGQCLACRGVVLEVGLFALQAVNHLAGAVKLVHLAIEERLDALQVLPSVGEVVVKVAERAQVRVGVTVGALHPANEIEHGVYLGLARVALACITLCKEPVKLSRLIVEPHMQGLHQAVLILRNVLLAGKLAQQGTGAVERGGGHAAAGLDDCLGDLGAVVQVLGQLDVLGGHLVASHAHARLLVVDELGGNGGHVKLRPAKRLCLIEVLQGLHRHRLVVGKLHVQVACHHLACPCIEAVVNEAVAQQDAAQLHLSLHVELHELAAAVHRVHQLAQGVLDTLARTVGAAFGKLAARCVHARLGKRALEYTLELLFQRTLLILVGGDDGARLLG